MIFFSAMKVSPVMEPPVVRTKITMDIQMNLYSAVGVTVIKIIVQPFLIVDKKMRTVIDKVMLVISMMIMTLYQIIW